MTDGVVRRAPRRPDEDARFRERRRLPGFHLEALIRCAVSVLVLMFNETVRIGPDPGPSSLIRWAALAGFLLNGLYYLALRTRRSVRAQAYGRLVVDLGLLTLVLAGAGGAAATPYLGVYTIIAVYAGLTLSSAACLLVTLTATVTYLAILLLHQAGWLTLAEPPTSTSLAVAAVNLLVLNIVGGLTAILAQAYRRSRRRLGLLYQELERAHDQAVRLNAEIQRGARLHALGAVAAGVSHEVGNALQAAVFPLELMRQKLGTVAPEMGRHLEQVQHGYDTAIRIVGNVLQTARDASGEKVPVSLTEVARRTVELTGYDLRRAGIAVTLDFPPDLPPVLGVPYQFQQVLLNLVTNARDALRGARGPARAIAIVGLVEGDRAVVEVRDTGPGIPSETLPRLFEPFYTTKPDGTGLGLAISSDIVRSLGGDLTAANRPEGGAVFRARFPVAVSGRSGGGSSGSSRAPA